MDITAFLPFIVIVVVALVVLSTIFVVRQQTVAIIERFGKFHKIKTPGIHIRAPFGIDKIAVRADLRVQQSNIVIQAKTKDNVFIDLILAVQFKVDEKNVMASYYQLSQPVAQIKAYVEDAIRSSLPKYTLDEAFEKKEEIALDVFETVKTEMTEYGYVIVRTLITTIEPDAEVKNSMNEINAAQRKRVAAQELAEADKIKVVTAASAEAEKDRLHGVGLAEQRKAVVEGLSESFAELKGAGLSEREVMSILLTNQYLDTLNSFAQSGNNAIFLPAGVNATEDIRSTIMSSLMAAEKTRDKG